jgi:hypothetical protein
MIASRLDERDAVSRKVMIKIRKLAFARLGYWCAAGHGSWEPDPDTAEITKLDPSEVLTTAQSAKLLDPLIKLVPSFDEMVLGKSPPKVA